MKTNNKPAPRLKGIIDPLIEPLGIKESLELKDKVSKYQSYWMARIFLLWMLGVVIFVLVIQAWMLGASWDLWDDLDPDSYMPLVLLLYMAVLGPLGWCMAYTGMCERLTKHVKNLAGVENDKSD